MVSSNGPELGRGTTTTPSSQLQTSLQYLINPHRIHSRQLDIFVYSYLNTNTANDPPPQKKNQKKTTNTNTNNKQTHTQKYNQKTHKQNKTKQNKQTNPQNPAKNNNTILTKIKTRKQENKTNNT